ncbi:mariner Mos1 transposase [Trichonephila clavipes]|nr:mariner Mos1 transposase [Trichonephila clavipes]
MAAHVGGVSKKNEEYGRPAKTFEDAELQDLLDEDDGQTQEHLAEQLNVDQSTVSCRLKAMPVQIDRKAESLRPQDNDEYFLGSGGTNLFYIYELLKPDETINTDLYKQQILNLNNAILEKREQYKKRQHKVIFLDDNAPSHRTKPTKDIVKALGWEPLAHAAYLPDLSPSDYHLFESLEHALADQRFTSYENVKSWLDDWLASKDRSFFGVVFSNCPKDGENV